jgi:hypothetical protein
MMNHGLPASVNATFLNKEISLKANFDIKKNDEIFINYGTPAAYNSRKGREIKA